MRQTSCVAVAVGLTLSIVVACGSGAISPSVQQGIDRETYLRRVAPDLVITQTVNPATARPGDEVVFTLQVSNRRPASAPKVVVTDRLPSSVTFASCSAPESATCGGNVNDRTVSFDALGGGVSAIVSFTATLNQNLAVGTQVTNVASVAFDGTDPNPDDNSASASVTVAAP